MAKNKGKSNKQDTREQTYRDQIQKLRAKVRKQARIIKQLRSELGKQRNVEDDYNELLQDLETQKDTLPKEETKYCPQCSGKISFVDLGRFGTIENCENCSYRKRKK